MQQGPITIHPGLTQQIVAALPVPVVLLLEKYPGLCVAGGFVRDAIIGAEWKDIDIFATNHKNFAEGTDFFVWDSGADILKDLENPHSRGYVIRDENTRQDQNISVQFINCEYYPNHYSTILSFDFSICQVATFRGLDGFTTIATPEASEDIPAHNIRYMDPERGDGDESACLMRLAKFLMNGWKITPEELTKVAQRFVACTTNQSGTNLRERVKNAVMRGRTSS